MTVGHWATDTDHARTCEPVGHRRVERRKCPHQPCQGRSTHYGKANGVALTIGCEWHMRGWVKDPGASSRRRHAMAQAKLAQVRAADFVWMHRTGGRKKVHAFVRGEGLCSRARFAAGSQVFGLLWEVTEYEPAKLSAGGRPFGDVCSTCEGAVKKRGVA